MINPLGKSGLNMIIYFLLLGTSRRKYDILINNFIQKFKKIYTPYSVVLDRLRLHKENGDEIIFISGSPYELINPIYGTMISSDTLIASEIKSWCCSFFISKRCVSHKKMEYLKEKMKFITEFEYGYTDSLSDMPVLKFCKNRFIVNKNGDINEI
ncbi:haloacid dehalogenase-like hydrolase [Actinobacillus capsulatus]|uniref:haloacid dehalogenase-like hydrolase n=1 Tax=Actinobacillus capsulatus TaxID=717 RepID=UPI0014613CC6|nr:haloacid dehalogenase-like hydrolase [Actinobacillus capsulatus]